MPVKVYGASDDLVEVEGDIREEFYALGEFDNGEAKDGGYLAFSNGAVFRIEYTNQGVWRITPTVAYPAGHDFRVIQTPADDEDNYSDILEMEDTIEWVVFGSTYALRKF